MSLIDSIKNKISEIEDTNLTPAAFTAFFLSIAFVRNYTEGLIGASGTIGTSVSADTSLFQMGVLFNLEWITLFLAVACMVSFFSRVPIVNILKSAVFMFPLIIIVPFADLIFSFPSGCYIDYIYTAEGYIKALLFFFVPWKDAGVCPGIRLEVFAAFILTVTYVMLKTGSFARAAACSLSVYFLAVSSMAFPVFIIIPASLFIPDSAGFISEFFLSPRTNSTLINRVAMMISVLLAPVVVFAFSLHYGIKKIISFLRHVPFTYFAAAIACLASGFFASGISFLTDPVFYSLQLILSLLIISAVLYFPLIPASFVFSALAVILPVSSSVSFHFMLSLIFIVSSGLIIRRLNSGDSSGLTSSPFAASVFFSASFIAGHAAALTGPSFPLNKTLICLFILLSVYFSLKTAAHSWYSVLLLFIYGLMPVFFGKNLLAVSVPALAAVMLIIFYSFPGKKPHLLLLLFSFLLPAALFVK